MEYIYKKWYKLQNKSDSRAVYEARFCGETTQKTGLFIHPMQQKDDFELYYLPTAEMMMKLETVFLQDKKLLHLGEGLPQIAREQFLVDVIAQELYSSNDIEGVKSSKREIAESARMIAKGRGSKKLRMHSMITTYLKLSEKSVALPQDPADIRALYDVITEGEIDAENLPDGEIFTIHGADVSGASYGKILHKGVLGEAKIIEHVEALLRFMKDESIPYMVRVAIGHYYFGYIHPFYDGNGRTSRFVTSLYLSEIFSVYTAYSFSNGCRLMHKAYLDMFAVTNRFNSFGEMNALIDTFLDIVLAGQGHLIALLQEKTALLEKSREVVEADGFLMAHPLCALTMLFYSQALLFSDGVLAKSEVSSRLKETREGWSVREINEAFALLEERNYLLKTKNRPIQYIINSAFLE